MNLPSARKSWGVFCVRESPSTTVLPPPSGRPASEFLYVMPRESRSTSVRACSSEANGHMRIPPSPGPSTVL